MRLFEIWELVDFPHLDLICFRCGHGWHEGPMRINAWSQIIEIFRPDYKYIPSMVLKQEFRLRKFFLKFPSSPYPSVKKKNKQKECFLYVCLWQGMTNQGGYNDL